MGDQLYQFYCAAGWMRNHIPHFATITANGLMSTPDYQSERRKLIHTTLPIATRVANGPQAETAIELELKQLGHWNQLLSNGERAEMAQTLYQREVAEDLAANDCRTGQGEQNQRTCVHACVHA
eukprot:GHVU01116927.1.p1 GENE.GHVU01116927.1~~GHVU01116927.1.p1  ORF type:complete len:132 (-),score=10.18 GHVU01116927.1:126-497(-)